MGRAPIMHIQSIPDLVTPRKGPGAEVAGDFYWIIIMVILMIIIILHHGADDYNHMGMQEGFTVGLT